MGRSLSLAAYRALTWRNPLAGRDASPPRPMGELIWVHATTRQRFLALTELGHRLASQRPGLQVLFTCPTQTDALEWVLPETVLIPLPPDHVGACRAFLNHWAPDMCLWAGGDLRPNIISQMPDRNIPAILLDYGESDLPLKRHRWLPDLLRTTLDCFELIMVRSNKAAQFIRRSGIGPRKVSVAAELRVSPLPPSWPEDEFAEMAQELAARPIWLAAWVREDEIDTVLRAHRSSLRLLHRLLLVVHLADATAAGNFQKQLARTNMRCADWDAGDAIEDTTQILLSTVSEDLGLWYRVAPLTFMGSSLTAGARGRNPLPAIALGSAMVYGPNVRDHIDTYSRLAAAGAARSVRDAETLGASVVQLSAPDSAAEMALAGWQVVTEGAYLTDQIIEIIQDRLDQRGAGRARS